MILRHEFASHVQEHNGRPSNKRLRWVTG